MNITFVNHSKITVHILINSDKLSVAPNHKQQIIFNSNSINVGFFPDGKSFLNQHKSFEFQLLSSYAISSVNSEVIIYMNAYKTGGDNWEDYSYVLLSGNMADARLQSLSVIDKNEIINEIIKEDLNNDNRNSSKKTDFKIGVMVETILSSVPVMFVVYLIAKHFFDMKTILLILLFIVKGD